MAKNKDHNPSGRFVSWAYCIKCGLLYLRNQPTQKAIKSACPGASEDKP
jgi:hypothetical protein